MQQLRVGIFMGGRSIEREVSFNSGRTVCDHLDSSRYEVVPIYQTMKGELYILPWRFLHRGKTSDFEARLSNEAEHIVWDHLSHRIDFMYIAMHGRYAEDGILQGTLEVLGIPYLGSSRLASAICMDKIVTKRFLSYHGIHVPRGIALYPHELTQSSTAIIKQLAKQKISFPCIVKPHKEGSSLGVSLVNNSEQLLPAIEQASSVHPAKKQAVIIEECVKGMEFSCITLVDYKMKQFMPLMPTEIVCEKSSLFFDYDQKYMPGRATKFTPPRCKPEIIARIQQTCVRIMELLDIQTISRIDGFVTPDDRIVIVDPNTSSGMAPSSFLFREAAAMTNMNHTELINHLITTDLYRYGLTSATQETKEKKGPSMTPKLRVAVLLGGPSHEREISLESGRNIIYKLSPKSYDTTSIFVSHDMKLYVLTKSQLVLNSTREISQSIQSDQNITWHSLKDRYDFVFIGLHGGPGENGSVQGMLEMLDIPYNGSSILASALCMDKYKTTQYLKSAGFDTPNNMLIHNETWQYDKKTLLETITSHIQAPYIVKPNDDGCSVLVQKATTQKELTLAIEAIFQSGKTSALIEECLTGMELTVGVIGNNIPCALPPSCAITHNAILSIEEKFLPGAGENQTPAPLPEASLHFVQKTMERVYQEVGCKGYARIDCFYQSPHESPTKKERVIILEINTLPGMTPATCIFHQAAEIGMKPMEFIDRIVQYGLEEHQSKEAESAHSAHNKEHIVER